MGDRLLEKGDKMRKYEIWGMLPNSITMVNRFVYTKELGRAITAGIRSLERIYGCKVEWIGTKTYLHTI